MLIYESIEEPGKFVKGDQITNSAMPLVARFVGASYHIETHDGISLPWIEIHKGRNILVAHAGDYFYTDNNGESFSFMRPDEFEAQWKEVYDPEVDGDENKYFDPEVDESHHKDDDDQANGGDFVDIYSNDFMLA